MQATPSPEKQSRTPHPWRRELVVVAGLLALAVGVRAVVLAGWSETPLFDSLSGDELNFHQTALGLLGIEGTPDAFLYQPLYAFFLAVVYALIGVDPVAVRIIQLAIGLVTVLLMYGLGRELAGVWAGRAAAFLTAVYGPLVLFESQLLAPTIIAPLLVGGLWCLLCAGRGQRSYLLLPAGLLMGLAAMGRPDVMVMFPVAGCWWLWRVTRWGPRLLGLGLAIAGVAMGMAPAAIHNARHGAGLVPVSTAGGLSFFLGNNPQATGRFFVPRDMRIDASSHDAYRRSWHLLAEEATGRQLSPPAVSSYWWHRGLEFVASQPGAAASLYARKLLLAVNADEMPIQHSYRAVADLIPLLRWLIGFGVLLPGAAVGVALGLRRVRGVELLIALFVCQWCVLAAFYVSDRYRMVLVPLAIALTAVGVAVLMARGRPSWRELRWALVILAAAVAVSQIPFISPANDLEARAGLLNQMGRAAAEHGDLGTAAAYFERAAASGAVAQASLAEANLGRVAELGGRIEEARARFLHAQTLDGENRFALRKLAELDEARGDLQGALQWYRRLAAVEADPEETEADVARIQELLRQAAKRRDAFRE